MTKRQLHIAVACAALMASLAQAQTTVTLSGTVDANVGTQQFSGSAKTTRVESGGLATSQVNFDGVEDLGAGVKAEFALGMFLRTDTGASGRFDGDALFGRRAFVGLISPMGTLRLGRQTDIGFVQMIRTNSLADSSAFSPVFLHTYRSAVGMGTAFLSPGAPPASRSLTGALGTTDSAWNNAVSYISPVVAGGLTLSVMYAPGELSNVGNRTSAGAFYASGPLNLGLSVARFGAGAVPASGPAAAVINRQTSIEVSGAYAFEFARLSAGYFDHKRDYTVVTDDKVKTLQVGASVPVGRGTVLLQVAQSRQTPDVGNATRRTTSTLGYDHALSKRSDVYALAMNDRFTQLNKGNSVVVGLRHRF